MNASVSLAECGHPRVRVRARSRSRMSSLLDTRALTGIAIQLLSARRRLSLRTGGELPTVGELAVALRMYMAHCDEERTRLSPSSSSPDSSDAFCTPAEKRRLRLLIELADLCYKPRSVLLTRAGRSPTFQLLSARHEAERWSPAYYLAYMPEDRTLLLAVRGSQETSDFLTNLSVETEPFLDGVGHRGIVRSARNLLAKLRPTLHSVITSEHQVNQVVVVGHSLGGAVAAAITLMLRAGAGTSSSPSEHRSGSDTIVAPDHPLLRRATCVALGSPPFLSRRLAARTAQMGVTTVVTGLDVVPRLSAASLDRFLLRVAQFDWGASLGASVGRAASGFVSPETAAQVEQFVSNRGASTAAWAVSAFNAAARGALNHRRTRGNSASSSSSSMVDGVLSIGVMASSLIESQFFSSQSSQRQPEYAFARHFGMSGEDVERVLGEEGPPDMFLAGEVVHFNIPLPRFDDDGNEINPDASQRPTTIRRIARDQLKDVEGSAWMIAHHKPSLLIQELDSMIALQSAAHNE